MLPVNIVAARLIRFTNLLLYDSFYPIPILKLSSVKFVKNL